MFQNYDGNLVNFLFFFLLLLRLLLYIYPLLFFTNKNNCNQLCRIHLIVFLLCVSQSPEPPPPSSLCMCVRVIFSVCLCLLFSLTFFCTSTNYFAKRWRQKKKLYSGKIFELFCYSFLVFVSLLLTRERAKNLKKTDSRPPTHPLNFFYFSPS